MFDKLFNPSKADAEKLWKELYNQYDIGLRYYKKQVNAGNVTPDIGEMGYELSKLRHFLKRFSKYSRAKKL